MQIIDLPGFRDFAMNEEGARLQKQIDDMLQYFMDDPRNVLLCVEQAGDAANAATLARCKRVDPNHSRTILIRNKLDKYYRDLTASNVNKWLEGHGDLPEHLVKFCVSLPHWNEKEPPPKDFVVMRKEADENDQRELAERGASAKHLQFIGYTNFANCMQKKIAQEFRDSLGPCMKWLRDRLDTLTSECTACREELENTDSKNVLNTIRDAGLSFAKAAHPVMEGHLACEVKRVTLAQELEEFHQWAKITGIDQPADGRDGFDLLPTEDFACVEDYIEYLRTECKVPAFDVELNGGAQYSRLKYECEVFFRFADVGGEISSRDVTNALGTGNILGGNVPEAVKKLLQKMGQKSVSRKTEYVAARLQHFFLTQKEVLLEFMDKLDGSPEEHMYSNLFIQRVNIIKGNETAQKLIFSEYDKTIGESRSRFLDLFKLSVNAVFLNPFDLIKSSSMSMVLDEGGLDDVTLPSLEDTKARITTELDLRTRVRQNTKQLFMQIPSEAGKLDDAVDQVQAMIVTIFACIRDMLADQLELLAESFYLLPMLRHLEVAMCELEMTDESKQETQIRREILEINERKLAKKMEDFQWCVKEVQGFAMECQRVGPAR